MMDVKKIIERLKKATGYSFEGLKTAFASEVAFRQEVWGFILLFPIALLVHVTAADRAILIASLFMVLIVEIINTAIENIVNRISTDHHELSKNAKDLGSAAVFLSLIMTVIIWIIILI